MKPSALIFAAVAAGAAITGLWKRSDSNDRENLAPLPHLKKETVFANPGLSEDSRPLVSRFMDGEFKKLSPEQLARFVESRSRNAPSLLAAWDIGGDESWLEAAAREHPDDPKVAVAMLMRSGIGSEDAGKWIEVIIKNDPDNAAGNLYSARAAFASGDAFSALVELRAMGATKRAHFFTDSSQANLVAAYEYAGYPKGVAKMLGFSAVKIPSADMVGLSRDISDAMAAAHLAGDPELARSLGEAGMAAAERSAEGGGYLITRLIGLSMQRKVLEQLDEFELIPGDRELVIDRVEDLERESSTIRELVRESGEILTSMTEAEALQYFDLMESEGEMGALRWLVAKRGGEKP